MDEFHAPSSKDSPMASETEEDEFESYCRNQGMTSYKCQIGCVCACSPHMLLISWFLCFFKKIGGEGNFLMPRFEGMNLCFTN